MIGDTRVFEAGKRAPPRPDRPVLDPPGVSEDRTGVAHNLSAVFTSGMLQHVDLQVIPYLVVHVFSGGGRI